MTTDTKCAMRPYFTSLIALMSALLLGGCGTAGTPEVTRPSPRGPAEIQFDLVARHGEQFDRDVPERRPGSQEEIAAGSYVLGHLQLAGYAPYLDAVPVEDQVRSTNVVALPPSGKEPETVVTIAYDTGPDPRSGPPGRFLGLFLEVARALNVAEPDHSVAFVAVGAESAEHRGTRRLARYLLDEGWEPIVYSIAEELPPAEDAVAAAGFDHRFTYGDVRAVAGELFPLLLGTRS